MADLHFTSPPESQTMNSRQSLTKLELFTLPREEYISKIGCYVRDVYGLAVDMENLASIPESLLNLKTRNIMRIHIKGRRAFVVFVAIIKEGNALMHPYMSDEQNRFLECMAAYIDGCAVSMNNYIDSLKIMIGPYGKEKE